MSLPASVVQVPVVSGYVYRDATGTVPEGARVVFTARTKSVVVDDATVTLPAKLVALVTAAGALPADFTLQTAGDGVYYDVIEDFSGGRAKFTILVLTTDVEINLATAAPVADLPAWVEAAQSPAVAEVVALAAAHSTAAQAAQAAAEAAEDTATTSAQSASDSADAAAGSAASMTNAVRGDSAKTYRTLGSVIRNSGSGWAFISDTAHGPAGMSGALTILADPEGYKLRVPYSFTGAKVVTLVVAPDETFGTRGISVGASAVNNEAILQASMNLRFRTSGMTAVADQSTYFGSRVSIAANATNTGFVATVPTMLPGLALPQVSVRAADARNLPVRVKAINSTSFEVIAYSQLQARCYYDGSAWQFATNNVCGLTASFSAGVLTITHDSSGITNLGAMACRLDGKYEPRISSRSLNSIAIRFYNSSGTQVTTADTSMSFEFSRPHEFPALMPTTQACNIDCGRCFLYWADISDANGNFWLHGLLET